MLMFTPADLAKRWQCSPDAVLTLIRSRRLAAFSVSPPSSKRPRYRVTAQALADYEAGHQPCAPAKPATRQRRRTDGVHEFYK
jgi:hypothetical protein